MRNSVMLMEYLNLSRIREYCFFYSLTSMKTLNLVYRIGLRASLT